MSIRIARLTAAAALAASISVTSAQAGGMAEPLMEPEVLVEETAASSAGGIIIPLLLLALIAVASSGSGGGGLGPA